MRFSVLMANYNGAKFLDAAVNSIMAQTYPQWELIIVDDASTDKSLDKIRKFRDQRIRLVNRAVNGGYGLTLRTAIEYATGQVCGIVDSDDVIDPEAIEIMVGEHERHPECSLIYSQFMKCDEKLRPQKKGDCGPLVPGKTWLDYLRFKIRPKVRVSHFKTFKRSSYDKTEGFHEFRRTVDKDIVLKLEEVGAIRFINKVLYQYRVHSQCISRNQKTHPFGKTIIDRAVARRKK